MPTATAAKIDSRPATPERHTPGEPGFWIMLLGDMTVFAALFVVFLVQRARHAGLFTSAQNHLNRDLGAFNTIVLLSSSLLVVLAMRALRGPGRRHAPRLLAGAIVLGLTFIAIKAVEYHETLVAGNTPHTNAFFSYYFALTGLHLAHLTVGLIVLVVLMRLSRKPELTPGQAVFFEAGACFWHMVDLLWIIIFPLVYLVR